MPKDSIYRLFVLWLIAVLGILTSIVTLLFIIGGAGIYGSPFSGTLYQKMSLFGILLFGPLAFIACVVLEWKKPAMGGILLCILAQVEAGYAILITTMSLANSYDGAGWLTCCISLPMFLVGSMMLHSTPMPTKPKEFRICWWIMLAIMATNLSVYAYLYGKDVWIRLNWV